MDKITNHFHEPEWWFSAIFIGLLINLLSTYVYSRIGNAYVQISKSSRLKKEKREIQIARMAKALKGRLEERMHLQFMHSKGSVRICINYIACAMFTSIGAGAVVFGYFWFAGACAVLVAYVSWDLYRESRSNDFLDRVLRDSIADSPWWNSYRDPATAQHSSDTQKPEGNVTK